MHLAHVALGQEQRLVVRARVVRDQALTVFLHERQADAIEGDQRRGRLEEEVADVVERWLGGDLLVDRAEYRPLLVADALLVAATLERVEIA